jgi:hypothetical protein
VTTALVDIAKERRRQLLEEGCSLERDDAYQQNELLRAAESYVGHARRFAGRETYSGIVAPELWPFDRSWWKPKSRRKDLVRAAALIVAEIERLDRIEAGTKEIL